MENNMDTKKATNRATKFIEYLAMCVRWFERKTLPR